MQERKVGGKIQLLAVQGKNIDEAFRRKKNLFKGPGSPEERRKKKKRGGEIRKKGAHGRKTDPVVAEKM